MAEVRKIEDFEVGIPAETEDIPKPPQQEMEQPPRKSPRPKRKKRFSNFERLVFIGAVVLFIGLAFTVVKMRTELIQVTSDITSIQAKTAENMEANDLLEQEISELSKVDRIKKIAEKLGLTTTSEENIKRVNP